MNRKTWIAYSSEQNANLAAQNIASQLDHSEIGFVIFFCSASFDLPQLAKGLKSHFAHLPLVGCTTAGEITPNGYAQHCLMAIGFSSQFFTLQTRLVKSLPNFNLIDAHSIINELYETTKFDHGECDNRLLLSLMDGLSTQEEAFLVALNSAANAIPHFGGSAGDDINLAQTHVYYEGKFYRNAAIVTMLNARVPFQVFSLSHIAETGEKHVVTRADANSRKVYELDAEPAAQVYARIFGIRVEDLTPEFFAMHPMAVKVGGEYFIRSIQKVDQEDLSLTFYCAVDTGIVLTQAKLGDLLTEIKDNMLSIEHRLGPSELVMVCDCFLNRLELEQRSMQQPAKQLFNRFNVLGFNTYGEHLGGVHINQTFTGVYFAEDQSIGHRHDEK